MTQLAARTTGGIIKVGLVTGGTGYTGLPTVAITGNGTGASAVAIMAGTAVASVAIVSPGRGYTGATITISGGGGTSAAATAAVGSSTIRPMSFIKGRFNDMYGFDGMGRGIRWSGSGSATPIGLVPPARGPAVTASVSASYYVSGIQVISPGSGFSQLPTITLSGGGYSVPATAQAKIMNGQLAAVTVSDKGSGYQTAPTVEVSGGQGTGAALSIGVVGTIADVLVVGRGTPINSITGSSSSGQQVNLIFSTAQGLTNAMATVYINDDHTIGPVSVMSNGTGATTTGVTASITQIAGVTFDVKMSYRVNSITVSNSGSGYKTQPLVSVRAASIDPYSGGAAATAYVNSTGNVTGTSVYAGGLYTAVPEALIYPTPAKASAIISSNMRGIYQCAIRYLDDTPASQNGPVPSSISELVEINTGESSASLTWSFTHGTLDDRVTAMELWRTSSDQSVILYRVATIQRASFSSTYVDTIQDPDLIDTKRSGFGLMPVTLPSGQLNARRFEVPPGNFGIACMFQDRAWYAFDLTGEKNNSLFYSEIDEPESVSEVNELILQQNTGTPDTIQGLIPMASSLFIFQNAHAYKLSYVAQPVIDASLLLASYRGMLNQRCYAMLNGVAFIADSIGLYAFDGQQEDPVSVPVDNYWRDGIIDLTRRSEFHVSCDYLRKIIRLHYAKSGDTGIIRALCYCATTKAWWEENYPTSMTASVSIWNNGKCDSLFGTAGYFTKPSGLVDVSANVSYEMRTGNMTLKPGSQSRAIQVVYGPTTSDATLSAKLHYNNSDTPRANAIQYASGAGFEATTDGAAINLKKTRSALGDATGVATAQYSGHFDPRSSGADRHMAVDLSGQQTSDQIIIYDVSIDGVGE